MIISTRQDLSLRGRFPESQVQTSILCYEKRLLKEELKNRVKKHFSHLKMGSVWQSLNINQLSTAISTAILVNAVSWHFFRLTESVLKILLGMMCFFKRLNPDLREILVSIALSRSTGFLRIEVFNSWSNFWTFYGQNCQDKASATISFHFFNLVY